MKSTDGSFTNLYCEKKALQCQWYRRLACLEGREKLLVFLSYHCAPLRKNLKPSVLLNFQGRSRWTYQLWECHGASTCRELGLEYHVLKKTVNNSLVLFYRTDNLVEHIMRNRTQEKLGLWGYPPMGVDGKEVLLPLFDKLKDRIENTKTFPHEIGLFLGIPWRDIMGYVQNGGKNYLVCRDWKVYRAPDEALVIFGAFENARICAMKQLLDWPVEPLAI